MSPKLPEFVDFGETNLGVLPKKEEILIRGFDITKRLLKRMEKFHFDGKEEQIREYFLSDSDEGAEKIFEYGNSISAMILVQEKNSLITDIKIVCQKVNRLFSCLEFNSDEIILLQNSIFAIYRQLVEQPLIEIEAQIDQQIATLANNIMLRRLMKRTRGSAMDVLKS